MDKHLAAPVALILASAVALLVPAVRGLLLRVILYVLFAAVGWLMLSRDKKAGLLNKSPGQIYKEARAGRIKHRALEAAAMLAGLIALHQMTPWPLT